MNIPFYLVKDAKKIIVKRTSAMDINELNTWQRHIPVMPLVSIDTPYDDDYNKDKTPWHYITQDCSDTPQAYEDAKEGWGGLLAIDSIVNQYKEIIAQLDGVEDILKEELDLAGVKSNKLFFELEDSKIKLKELEEEAQERGDWSYKKEEQESLANSIRELKELEKEASKAYDKAFNEHLCFTERVHHCEDMFSLDCAADILEHAQEMVTHAEAYKAKWLQEVCKTYDSFLDSHGWEEGMIVEAADYEYWVLDALQSQQNEFSRGLTSF